MHFLWLNNLEKTVIWKTNSIVYVIQNIKNYFIFTQQKWIYHQWKFGWVKVLYVEVRGLSPWNLKYQICCLSLITQIPVVFRRSVETSSLSKYGYLDCCLTKRNHNLLFVRVFATSFLILIIMVLLLVFICINYVYVCRR